MIEVVGIGLDGAAGLTETVREIVEKATLLVGSDRHLSYFPNHQAKRLVLRDLNDAIAAIVQALSAGECIVILVSGDPLFFGLGRLLLTHFPEPQLRFHPHLCSIQLAFNRIKIPWQDARIISAHGRSLDELAQLLQGGIEKVGILTDTNNNPAAIARYYLGLGLATPYNFWVCENLGDAQTEQINHYPALQVKSLASQPGDRFASLNVVILIRQELSHSLNLANLPLLGLPDNYFLSFRDRPGLMTKREVRLMVLGELGLQPKQIVWDIGAGTGSVSIEIARLCPSSEIYAIEKTAMGIALIEQNCQRFQVNNVNYIYGNAPQILEELPQPNRIFIGGSGGNLSEILDICSEKLLPNGIIVMALATLENISESLEWLNRTGWNYHLLQLQISRSVPVGKLTRFHPLNPVTLVRVNL